MELDSESKHIVHQQLSKLGMLKYQGLVEKAMLGTEAPGEVLRLVITFFVIGNIRGRQDKPIELSPMIKGVIGK